MGSGLVVIYADGRVIGDRDITRVCGLVTEFIECAMPDWVCRWDATFSVEALPDVCSIICGR